MLDEKIIKWGSEFADGFDWNINGIEGLNVGQHCFFNLNVFTKGENKIKLNLLKNIYYPLFLQRVRRGIDCSFWDNGTKFRFQVIDKDIYLYHEDDTDNYIDKYPDTDEGLEKALEYIYDQN
jgi:hypothetical protein